MSTVEQVNLRALTLEDAESVYGLLSNWQVVRYMIFPLYSKQESETFVRDSLREFAGTPWRLIVRAMTVGEASEVVGLCGIGILQGSEEGEIWYLVKPEYWGRGMATAGVEGLLDLGFGQLGLHRLWACCLPENPGSAKVLQKVGMRLEGLRRKNLKIHGEWKDSWQYAILVEEWQPFRMGKQQ